MRRHQKNRQWKVLCFCVSAFFILSQAHGQGKDTADFRVMSYNVENLFDCRHDSLKDDYEFLPDAIRRWNYYKYRKKLDDVARVIVAVGEWNPPALVALCEVENDSVLRDLTRYSALREVGYRYVMTSSPDERGIDVALLYRRHLFKLLSCHSLEVPRTDKQNRPTRDILHVCGQLLNQDTLDVFVCHFPSRSGGAKETEAHRLLAARRVREAIDSIYARRRRPQILMMGDLNDYPHNRSVRLLLDGDKPVLKHLLDGKPGMKPAGSYKYQGEWGLLDYIMVSEEMTRPDAPFHTAEGRAGIFAPPFLLAPDKKYGGLQPFRTYYGMKYQEGYSDHLPVWADFRVLY